MRKSTQPKNQQNTTPNKLHPLRTTTVRKLTDDQLEQVAGGKCECCTLTCHGA